MYTDTDTDTDTHTHIHAHKETLGQSNPLTHNSQKVDPLAGSSPAHLQVAIRSRVSRRPSIQQNACDSHDIR